MTDFDLTTLSPPHPDRGILHAAGECWYCDKYPQWQALRGLWGIAFTGHDPDPDQVPCPSDARRARAGAHIRDDEWPATDVRKGNAWWRLPL